MSGGAEDVLVEAAFGANLLEDQDTWEWSDISTDRLIRESVTVSRGRADEASVVQPSSTSFRLKNDDGELTPGAPNSSHYGKWGRGTPVRLRVGDNPVAEVRGPGNGFTTPDSPALSLTGDQFIAVEIADIAAANGLVFSKYAAAGNRSWWLWLPSDKSVSVRWSTDGTALNGWSSALPTEWSTGPLALGIQFDVDNGAGGHDVILYVARSLGDPWVEIDRYVGAGAISLFDSTAPLAMGDPLSLGSGNEARITHMQYRQGGPTGAVVASFGYAPVDHEESPFEDAEGNVWTAVGDAAVNTLSVRMVGQASEVVPDWPHGDISRLPDDPGIADIQVSPSGLLRRLRQGSQTIQSPLRRGILNKVAQPSSIGLGDFVAYWPCEDAPGATSLAAETPNTKPITLKRVESGQESSLVSSSPLAVVASSAASMWVAEVPNFTVQDGMWSIQIMLKVNSIPSGFDQTGLLRVATTGVLRNLYVSVSSSGIGVAGVDAGGGLYAFSGSSFGDLTSTWIQFQIEAYEIPPSGVAYNCTWSFPGTGVSGYCNSPGIIPGSSVGRPVSIRHHVPTISTTDSVGFGHLSVATGGLAFYHLVEDDILLAYAGEPASTRVNRLCQEEGIDLHVVGWNNSPTYEDPSQRMGAQQVSSLGDLLQECADVDSAVLAESRNRLGLVYRPAEFRYNSVPVLTLDASSNEIAPPFTPTDDDQRLRNDVMVSRPFGSSARVRDETSIRVEGAYEDAAYLNAYEDTMLLDLAGWRLYVGTWPEMRYPELTVDLAAVASQDPDSPLLHLVPLVSEGDRIQVVGLPHQHPHDSIILTVEAVRESFTPKTRQFTFICSPGSVWDVRKVGEGRVESGGTVLDAAIDEDDTTFQVVSDDEWVNSADHPDEFPFQIEVGGEVMEVSGIDGSGVWTVTRSMNNVVKGHGAGEAVRLVDPIVVVP